MWEEVGLARVLHPVMLAIDWTSRGARPAGKVLESRRCCLSSSCRDLSDGFPATKNFYGDEARHGHGEESMSFTLVGNGWRRPEVAGKQLRCL